MKLKQTFAVLLAAGALVLTACTPRGAASSSAAAPTATAAPQPTEAPADSENTAAEPTASKILIAYFTAAENSGVDAVASASYSTVEGMPSGAFAHWRTLFKTMWAVTFSPSARWRLTRWASTR